MSKRNDSSEKKIEQMLTQMPRVKDERSKDEIYQKIKQQSQKRIPTKKKWAVPAFSVVAAMLLLLVLVPNVLNFTNQTSPNGSNESNGDNSTGIGTMEDQDEEKEKDTNELESSEAEKKESTEEYAMEPTEDEETAKEPSVKLGDDSFSHENYVTALNEGDMEENQTAVTVPLQDAETSMIVPVSFAVEDDEDYIETFEQWNEEFSGEDIGLDPSPLRDVDWSKESEESTLEADFEEEESLVGSAESNMVVRSLEESLRFLEETEVTLFEEEEQGVDFGNYGVMETYTAEQDNRGYYAYTSDADMTFLVSQNAANIRKTNQSGELLTFEETLNQMKTEHDVSEATASIPDTVTINQVAEDGDLARVVFSQDSEFPDSENIQLMVDAILFTASDFNFERVSFEGVPEDMEAFNVDEPVEIPVAPNQVAY
ncbi:hypothetical protein J2S78_002386 [Salibacterium salarium]|uniref:GerMN domain-containing protein n=1 Tax=Salibacterium salarium TaxID=284579 RepID=UPI0027867E1D|nr:GerMN domain-containing protein [Salibacterium salarium]MDQ0299939.1 hypothetical protein [Salibacterium salarium]